MHQSIIGKGPRWMVYPGCSLLAPHSTDNVELVYYLATAPARGASAAMAADLMVIDQRGKYTLNWAGTIWGRGGNTFKPIYATRSLTQVITDDSTLGYQDRTMLATAPSSAHHFQVDRQKLTGDQVAPGDAAVQLPVNWSRAGAGSPRDTNRGETDPTSGSILAIHTDVSDPTDGLRDIIAQPMNATMHPSLDKLAPLQFPRLGV